MISTLLAFGIQATISHTFVYDAPGELQSVHVAGTFNNWSNSADPMKLEGTRQWRLTKALPAGMHQYKFVLNGSTWITDPRSKKDVDDGNGNTNSELNLLSAEMREPASRTDSKVGLLTHRANEYPFVSYDRGQLTLRLQARTNDLKSAGVSIGSKTYPMTRVPDSDLHEWYQVTVPWATGREASYSFHAVSGSYRYKTGEKYKLKGDRVRPADVPAWPETTVLYQIFPERFANGDQGNDPANVIPWDGTPTYANFMGGDIAGVSEKIPYLKSLGVGGVYFNPIFKSPSNHGYETSDFLMVEPRFGTNVEFGALTRELRKNGIRTVLDGVFNHTATNFPQFADIVKNGESSKFKDWFFIKSYPVKVGDPPNYEAWFGFPSMPKLNTANPETEKYLRSVPAFWDKHADIAGWRLDVANEVPPAFWRKFRSEVKKLGRDRWIVGEVWGDGSQWLGGDQWDSIMGYQFRDAVLKFVANGTTKPSEYFRQLMKVHDSYAPGVSRNLMILIGSHDTPRILTLCKGDRDLAKLAATLQLTWIGAPSIYYGDEIGMAGDRDPENRRGMRWQDANPQNDMLIHYKRLIAARNSSKALQSGDAKLLLADDAKGILAYSRTLGKEFAVTAVNRSDKPLAVTLTLPKGRYHSVLDNVAVVNKDGKHVIMLDPQSSAVLVKRP